MRQRFLPLLLLLFSLFRLQGPAFEVVLRNLDALASWRWSLLEISAWRGVRELLERWEVVDDPCLALTFDGLRFRVMLQQLRHL